MFFQFITQNQRKIIYLLTLLGILGCSITIIIPLFYILIPFVNNPDTFIKGVLVLLNKPTYQAVLLNTFKVISLVSLICIILGIPIALYLWTSKPKYKTFILISLCIPFMMNQVARNYSWIQILDASGIINKTLIALQIIHNPIQLIYNNIGVSIVLAQGFFPIFVITVYLSLMSLPYEIVEASYCCGRGKLVTLFIIVFPNICRGIMGGLSLIGILSFGYFITPSMLGGSGGITLPKLLNDEFNVYGGEFNSVIQSFMIIILVMPLMFITIKNILKINKT